MKKTFTDFTARYARGRHLFGASGEAAQGMGQKSRARQSSGQPFLTQEEWRSLEEIAEWMDDKFIIPGTSIRFGLDSIFGLIPGVGDTGTLFVTLYLVDKANQLNLPPHIRRQMF
jgi:hypothetical protein